VGDPDRIRRPISKEVQIEEINFSMGGPAAESELGYTVMNLKEATAAARQILDEEQVSPTVHYVPMPFGEARDIARAGQAYMIHANPYFREHPRDVLEDTGLFTFDSTNHKLLSALLSRVSHIDQPHVIGFLGLGLVWGVGASQTSVRTYPKWNLLVSELPLIVEFLVRNGGKAQLFAMLENDKTKMIPGHVLMLLQLEDLISFNFTHFTDSEYSRLSRAALNFGKLAATKREEYEAQNVRDVQWPQTGGVSGTGMCRAIEKSCMGIIEQCRKARYFYLKGNLLEGLNLEVNQDKAAVESYLHRFGFSASLIETLNEVERLYQLQGNPFDSKNALGHLRSFLENVQKEVMPRIHQKYGGELRVDWGGGLAYLVKHEILSKAEELLAADLYRLISDEGVHPLIAQREYVRLARNMVVEYSLLFLTKVAKLGLADQRGV
jgi:hypothetical protein